MKINNTQNISFQKKLVGLGAVKQADVSKAVKFFRLDELSDIVDLKNAQKAQQWHGNYYLNDVVAGNNYYIKNFSVFTMEDEAKNLLGFSILENNDSCTILDIIETAPRLSCYREKRPIKYIGESMMAFIATLSGKKDVKVIDIAQRPKTKKFYFSQCGFSKNLFNDGAVLKRRNFKRLINANEAHTGKKVELVI